MEASGRAVQEIRSGLAEEEEDIRPSLTLSMERAAVAEEGETTLPTWPEGLAAMAVD